MELHRTATNLALTGGGRRKRGGEGRQLFHLLLPESTYSGWALVHTWKGLLHKWQDAGWGMPLSFLLMRLKSRGLLRERERERERESWRQEHMDTIPCPSLGEPI